MRSIRSASLFLVPIGLPVVVTFALLLQLAANVAHAQESPQSSPGHATAQVANLEMQGKLRPSEESEDHAVDEIRREIAEKGPSADLYSRLGVALFRSHRPGPSLDAFTALLHYRQPNADEFRLLALDYVELRDLASADKWLHASIGLNPSDWKTWRYLGGVEFSEEQPTQAVDSFTECLKLDPSNALAEDGLARSLEALGRSTDARDHFERAIQLNTAQKTPSALPALHYGEFLYRQGVLDAALRQLSDSAHLVSEDPETHEFLSQIYQRKGNHTQALNEMKQAASLWPENPRLHFLLGRLYRENGDLKNAQEEIDRYVELSRRHEEAWDR